MVDVGCCTVERGCRLTQDDVDHSQRIGDSDIAVAIGIAGKNVGGGEGEGDEPRPVERVRVGGPNVAFATFLPPNMASPGRLNNADLDMYVSTNSALTNIDADVIAEAVENGWASRKQGGSELFYITNALENQVFDVGIKSEDQRLLNMDLWVFPARIHLMRMTTAII